MNTHKQSGKPSSSGRKSRSNSKKSTHSSENVRKHNTDFFTLMQAKEILLRGHVDAKKERPAKRAVRATMERATKLINEAERARKVRAQTLKAGKTGAVFEQQKKTKTQQLVQKIKSAEEYGEAKKLKANK